MIGQCNKVCENKTEFGYCKSTVCSNPRYNGISNVGINETIIFVQSFLDEGERSGRKIHLDGTIDSEGVRII